MMSANLFGRLTAAADPAAPFLETEAGERFSYASMHAHTARFAHALVALGVRPGDRVVAQVDKSAPALLLYLACLRAGAIYLPLNIAYTLAELEYFLTDSEPALLVCDAARAESAGELARRLGVPAVRTLTADGMSGTLLEASKGLPESFVDIVREDDDLAAILYTSGTTGRSKGAMLTHDNLASNAVLLREQWRFSAWDVLLHALPIFHTHGLFVAANTLMAAGGSMIFLQKFSPDAVFANLKRATSMMGVPTFYVRLLQDARLDAAAVAHMRLFTSGSAPLLAETHIEWRARTGHSILERYGMTETNMNTSNPYEGDRIPGTVGPALPGISVRVVDPDSGAPVDADEIGMIEVKGPNVFAGYWRMPEKTKAEFREDGFFITGDLGKIDTHGYVHIVGRGKDLIISGGYNVYPKEVEDELDALPEILESAVIGLPHTDFGEAVTAVVIVKSAISEAAIQAALKDRLAAYKLPKRVLFADELPRNAMGKVQKNLLRTQFAGLYDAKG